jgi:RimJ/RimL family protein N-acetyltransferase
MDSTEIAAFSCTEPLPDGRTVTIRAVRPEDKAGLLDALQRISAQSLYTRFFASRRAFSDREMTQAAEVDFVKVVALVAVLDHEGVERIVGGARYFRLDTPDNGGNAEVAFLVDDAYQGLGIAGRLFRHLVNIARACGIVRFEADVLPGNTAMLRVFERGGLSVARAAGSDSVHLEMQLTTE